MKLIGETYHPQRKLAEEIGKSKNLTLSVPFFTIVFLNNNPKLTTKSSTVQ